MKKHFDEISLIWNDAYPPSSPRPRTLIEKIICILTILVASISLGNFKDVIRHRFPGSHLFMDLYVIGWFLFLLCVLFFGGQWCSVAVLALVAYRLLDIFNYRVYFLFVKSETSPWTAKIVRRSVAIALTNFLESIVAFAILYQRTESVVQSGTATAIGSATDALYFSFVTMTTLGYGDYVPGTTLGRWLVMCELSTTILFVLFLLPALMSVFSPALIEKEREKDKEKEK
jgi:voltage-gated potassium channel